MIIDTTPINSSNTVPGTFYVSASSAHKGAEPQYWKVYIRTKNQVPGSTLVRFVVVNSGEFENPTL